MPLITHTASSATTLIVSCVREFFLGRVSYFNETLLHNIKGLAAYRGQMTATKYAEAFELKWRTI